MAGHMRQWLLRYSLHGIVSLQRQAALTVRDGPRRATAATASRATHVPQQQVRLGSSSQGTLDAPIGRAEQNALLKLLGITPEEANPLDPVLLKQRYYELAKKLHPDVVALGEREQHSQPWLRFAELTSAFERLIRHAQMLQEDNPPWGVCSSTPAERHSVEMTLGRSPRRGTMAASKLQQQAASTASCTQALRDRLGTSGASQLHALADEIEQQGEQASLGIDGPQGAFAVWWLSRDLQTVAPTRSSVAYRRQPRGRNRSRTRKKTVPPTARLAD
eukprot:COSAG02_NODE_6037_length_3854_cov_2.682823_3_plen_276_part_00